MIETTVVDDWLDKDLVNYLENLFLYNYPHYYGHKSNDSDTSCLYNSSLNINDSLNYFLFYKLKQTLKQKINLKRMYINIQHSNMNGSFHTDDGDMTCLYMVTQSLDKEGYFEIKNENKINFVQNRLIYFDAKKLHRGLAPTKLGKVRITLAFKLDVL
jgi:hypothetical protein|tara:strand:+ start:1766 stop:2239 length:474 start_codon:yes stop_codon:yes gene_type:complete